MRGLQEGPGKGTPNIQRLKQTEWVQETKEGKSGWSIAARGEDRGRKVGRSLVK